MRLQKLERYSDKEHDKDPDRLLPQVPWIPQLNNQLPAQCGCCGPVEQNESASLIICNVIIASPSE